MYLFRMMSTAACLAALVYAECNSRNQVSSWENQTFIDAGWRTPSSPMICQQIWNDTQAAPLQSVREKFGIDRFSLQYWNCFLDSADGLSIPHVGYCVKAVPELTPPSSEPFMTTQMSEQPPTSRPVKPPPPASASNLVWPLYEDLSSATWAEDATVSSTPRPSLTTLSSVTVSKSVFDRFAENKTTKAASLSPSASHEPSIFATLTITDDLFGRQEE